ncbi:hypothetical protein RCJ22_35300 [Vibrio sp. FNV 38]|nr:hypothetical protein [Vibrio sp. FNV 38]
MKTLFTAIIAIAFSAGVYATSNHDCKTMENDVPYSVCIQDKMNKKR